MARIILPDLIYRLTVSNEDSIDEIIAWLVDNEDEYIYIGTIYNDIAFQYDNNPSLFFTILGTMPSALIPEIVQTATVRDYRFSRRNQ